MLESFFVNFFLGDGWEVVAVWDFIFSLIDIVLTSAGKVCADPYNYGRKH
jgi:hypothetical protein